MLPDLAVYTTVGRCERRPELVLVILEDSLRLVLLILDVSLRTRTLDLLHPPDLGYDIARHFGMCLERLSQVSAVTLHQSFGHFRVVRPCDRRI
jgi:hypothetical protein